MIQCAERSALNYLEDEKIMQSYHFLKEQGAKEVFLFGSRCKGNYTDDSDLDLGVKGLPQEMYFSAIVDLEYKTKLRVDLVDFDWQNDFYEHLADTDALVRLGT